MNDPYLSLHVSVARLLKEYDQHPRLIVALDFDDTVFDFHGAGHKYPVLLSLVKRAQAKGFYIVVFTGSHPDKYSDCIDYLAAEGIHVDSVNKNPIELPYGNHGKIFYNILLDDRAGLGQSAMILQAVLDKIDWIG